MIAPLIIILGLALVLGGGTTSGFLSDVVLQFVSVIALGIAACGLRPGAVGHAREICRSPAGRIAVIPNGIDLPDHGDLAGLMEPEGPSASAAAPFVLALGRIHPKKGLDRLIAAFDRLAHDFPDWQLRIVGPDENDHASELRRQVAAAGLDRRVTLEPPVFGRDKLRLMRQAGVFALSTLNENFGMTVAESLAVETPVISTRGAPWQGLETYRCGWWVDHGPAAIADALRQAMEMSPDARRAMSGKWQPGLNMPTGHRSLG